MKKKLFNQVEKNNLEQIWSLRHRKTKFLSIIELIENGLLNPQLTGLLLYTILHKFSFIVAAGPDGAGKSTLMGALLAFLKPGTKIVSFNGKQDLPPSSKQCIIAHEIYNRPFYGYIWGKEVSDFITQARRGMIATTAHAENINELQEQLLKPPLSVEPKELYNIDLFIFITVEASLFQVKRKVDTIYYSCNEKFELLYSAADDFQRNNYYFERFIRNLARKLKTPPGIIYKDISKCTEFITYLQQKEIFSLADVRKEYLHQFWGIY